MDLTMLGTGHAGVTECYNTCFVISDDDGCIMVDGGGGFVIRQLKHAGFNWMDMRDIIVTHKHMDHLVGVVWMMRFICQRMAAGAYEGEARIYAHDEVIGILRSAGQSLLEPKDSQFIDNRLHLIEVHDGETRDVRGHEITFFDIRSTKAKQFGFSMLLPDGGHLVCCGDEPCTEASYRYAQGSEWLLHEAFCLAAQADRFRPYEKHHSTAKDASELAEKMHAENLVLYHTEDTNLAERKKLYSEEGKAFFSGNLFIPDDLETIPLTR